MEDTTPKPVSKHAKKITIAIVALIVAVGIGAGTIAILRSTTPANDTTDQSSQDKAVKAKEASAKYANALDLMKKGDTSNAKKALEDAQNLYKQAGDSSHDKDIQSSLSSLNKQDGQQPTQTAPAATQPASN